MLIIAFFVSCSFSIKHIAGASFQLTQAESLHCAPHKIRYANLVRAKGEREEKILFNPENPLNPG